MTSNRFWAYYLGDLPNLCSLVKNIFVEVKVVHKSIIPMSHSQIKCFNNNYNEICKQSLMGQAEKDSESVCQISQFVVEVAFLRFLT